MASTFIPCQNCRSAACADIQLMGPTKPDRARVADPPALGEDPSHRAPPSPVPMGEVTYLLSVEPEPEGDGYLLSFARQRDDGQRRWRESIALQKPRLVIPPGWLGAVAAVRREPAELARFGPSPIRDAWERAGRELSQALPPEIFARLDADVADGFTPRLFLTAAGDAAGLPWPLIGIGERHFVQGTARLLRRPTTAADTEPGAPAVPSILLVLLDTMQDPGQWSADPHVVELVAGVRAVAKAHGWKIDVVAGHARIGAGLVDGKAATSDQLCARIRSGSHTIVHFVGRSDADPTSGSPFGASGFQLRYGEIATGEAVAAALADPRCDARFVIAQACDVQSGLAEKLVTAGRVRHLAVTAAYIDPPSCVPWARKLYASLAETRSVTSALGVAATAHQIDHPHLVSLLHTWARDAGDLEFADADERLLRRYLNLLAAAVDRFEGRFQSRLRGTKLSQLYVELSAASSESGAELPPARRALMDALRAAIPEPSFPLTRLLEIDQPRGFLLGGKPGAGKSTTLRMLARSLALSRGARGVVPVFVSLPTWMAKPEQRLVDAALAPFARVLGGDLDRLKSVLERQGLVALLDGFDELGVSERRTFTDALSQHRTDCPDDRVIVSTRRYGDILSIDDLVDLDLQDLDPDRARRLLANVLIAGGRDEAIATEVATRWIDTIVAKGRTWRLLGRLPLFVTLLGELLLAGEEPAESRFDFFVQVFSRLCCGTHRVADSVDGGVRGALVPDDRDDASWVEGDVEGPSPALCRVLDILGGLALSMTRDMAIEWPVQKLLAALQSSREAVPQKLAEALRKIPGVDEPRPERAAERFLAETAQRSMILGPASVLPVDDDDLRLVDAAASTARRGPGPWRFWHRSFQEMLAAWVLVQQLRAGESLADVIAAIRMEPDKEREIEAAEQAVLAEDLTAAWKEPGQQRFWDFVQEFAPQWGEERLRGFLDASRRAEVDKEASRASAAAKAHAPLAAQARLRDFWIDILALALDGLVADFLDRKDPAAHDLAVGLVTSLCAEGRRQLARESLLRLDRCSVRLWQLALDATDHGDDVVRAARDGGALATAQTRRLQDRLPVYLELWPAVARAGLVDFEQALVQRAAVVEDPAELFLIEQIATRLRGADRGVFGQAGSVAGVADAIDAAVRARLDLACPDPAAWQGHLVAIPGGESWRGSGDGAFAERPLHRVELAPFWLGRTHVTVGHYRQFWPDHRIELGGSVATLRDWQGTVAGSDEPIDDRPVTYVSWFAAQMFCRWLDHHRSRSVAVTDVPSGYRVALPSEAQFECAVRGGMREPMDWWFGDQVLATSTAWFQDNAAGRSHAVGRKPDPGTAPHPFGLADPVGNVWCWCRDAFDARAYQAFGGDAVAAEPVRTGASAAARVVRGGSFYSAVLELLCAFRGWSHPASAGRDRGFRLALVAAPREPVAALDDR